MLSGVPRCAHTPGPPRRIPAKPGCGFPSSGDRLLASPTRGIPLEPKGFRR